MTSKKYRVKNTKTGNFVSGELSQMAANKLLSNLLLIADHYEVEEIEDEKVKQLEEASSQPRDMDDDEIYAIRHLHKVSSIFNDHKNFADDMYSRILTEEKLITEKQAAYLWHLVYRYRRQIYASRVITTAEERKVY